MREIKKTINNISFAIKYIFRFNKTYIIFSILISFLGFLGPITDVWGPKLIIDKLSLNQGIHSIIPIICIISIVEIIKGLVYGIYNYRYLPNTKLKIASKIKYDLFSKSAKIDLECYDSPEMYNHLSRAINESDQRFFSVIDSTSFLLNNLFYLSSLVAIIITLDYILLFVIIAVVISSTLLQNMKAKIQYKYDNSQTLPTRKMNYVSRVFVEPQYSKEIRTYKIADLLRNKFTNAVRDKTTVNNKYGKKLLFLDFLSNFIRIFCLIFFVMLYVTFQICNGRLTIGGFTATVIAVTQCSSQLIDLMRSISDFYRHSLYIDNFKKVYDYKSKIITSDDDNKPIFEGLVDEVVFKNVNFKYFGLEKYVLNDLCLTIKKGEKIALVGENGAGKSTLLKLLLRLYDVEEGAICIDGKNIIDYNVMSLRSKISIIFQDFQSYDITIGETVLMRKIMSSSDEIIVWNALEQVGLTEKVKELPKGIYTTIGKEFDSQGTQLSGGELQKLMIARVYANSIYSDILMFDEPTSALDPRSENEIIQYFIKACDTKTVLFVTHRLTMIPLADRIAFINDGKIEEFGSFDELMSLNGKFADLYRTQSSLYIQ